jgi:hypothetical protein
MTSTVAPVPASDAVDMTGVREELTLLLAKIDCIEDNPIPDKVKGRSRTQEMAEVTRQLLYLNHLAERVRMAIMDEYWHVRGQDDHLAP